MNSKRNTNIRHCEEFRHSYQDDEAISYASKVASSLATIWSGLVPRNDVHFDIYFFVLFIVCSATGCDSKISERVYDQVVIEAPGPDMSKMMDPHAGLGLDIAPMGGKGQAFQHGLSWDVPDGWSEIPGSGMRVVTFKNAKDPGAIDVSIITLSGEAGGLEPNLIRWGSQIDIDLQGDQGRLQEFIQKAESLKTRDGSVAKLFDFSKLQSSSGSSKSTVAAMLNVGDATVFVKMTGTVKTVAENLEPFKSLTQSLREQ